MSAKRDVTVPAVGGTHYPPSIGIKEYRRAQPFNVLLKKLTMS
jgi:hypothetical protein